VRVLHLFPRFRPNFAGDYSMAAVAKTYAALYESVLVRG